MCPFHYIFLFSSVFLSVPVVVLPFSVFIFFNNSSTTTGITLKFIFEVLMVVRNQILALWSMILCAVVAYQLLL